MPSDPNGFTPLSELGEFGLIDRLTALLGESDVEGVIKGIGDDAAVFAGGGGSVYLCTTDLLIDQVHFDRTYSSPEHIGVKAIAVNVSDIVAMCGRPKFAVVALGIPVSMSVEMVEGLYAGIRAACSQYGLVIAGGDTTAAQRLTLSVTVIGESPVSNVVYRSGARAGDILSVSRTLGDSFGGLSILRAHKEDLVAGRPAREASPEDMYLMRRHLLPEARLDLVDIFDDTGLRPSALIDISDGLASEVHHICRESGCSAIIERDAIPLSEALRTAAARRGDDPVDYALYGGEDYELLAAFRPETFALLKAMGVHFTQVGRCTDEMAGVRVVDESGNESSLDPAGFQHFSE